jgi:hypothetical protein
MRKYECEDASDWIPLAFQPEAVRKIEGMALWERMADYLGMNLNRNPSIERLQQRALGITSM